MTSKRALWIANAASPSEQNPAAGGRQEVTPTRSDDATLAEYRAHLLELEHKAQTSFDRTVLTLSGGALGISFAFVRDFIGTESVSDVGFLVGAWAGWIASLTMVLLSHYFSTLALRRAIEQVDAGTIYNEQVGGHYDVFVKWLNGLGGLSFVIGLVLIGFFVISNAG